MNDIDQHFITEQISLPGHDNCIYDDTCLRSMASAIARTLRSRHMNVDADSVFRAILLNSAVTPIFGARGTVYQICTKRDRSVIWMRAACEICGEETDGEYPHQGHIICWDCAPDHEKKVVAAEIDALRQGLNDALALIDDHTNKASSALFMTADDNIKLHRIIAKALHFDRDSVPVSKRGAT